MRRLVVWSLLALLGVGTHAAEAGKLPVRLRSRVEDREKSGRYSLVETPENWDSSKTAVIVCDMWDLHHCLNAVRRETEMAPRMNEVLRLLRAQGATIIHSPSECMATYKDNPARKRAEATPKSKSLPADIGTWCRKIPSEEKGAYPIDQTDGGEDDDLAEHKAWAEKLAGMGRNPKLPWKSQTDLLTIDNARDYITDKGEEVWSILDDRKIENVVLMGVHLNMCVLGRPFGLRQMAKNGRHVVLMRDMTDTMYNPERSPYVSHYAGTDLMIEHVEKFVCPSITSDQVLGGTPFKFKADPRPTIAFIIADDEYKTEATLPAFVSSHLLKDYRTTFILNSESTKNELPGINELADADLMFVAARRKVLPKEQLDAIRKFVAGGKPVVGIRTASHAFAPKAGAKVPEGRDGWATFDPEVLGGHYTNHHKVGPKSSVVVATGAESDVILKGVDASKITGCGSLYKVSPLAKSARPLLLGSIPGESPEPIAWTNESPAKGRVFYTSLGHVDDFAQADVSKLLRNAIDWAMAR